MQSGLGDAGTARGLRCEDLESSSGGTANGSDGTHAGIVTESPRCRIGETTQVERSMQAGLCILSSSGSSCSSESVCCRRGLDCRPNRFTESRGVDLHVIIGLCCHGFDTGASAEHDCMGSDPAAGSERLDAMGLATGTNTPEGLVAAGVVVLPTNLLGSGVAVLALEAPSGGPILTHELTVLSNDPPEWDSTPTSLSSP